MENTGSDGISYSYMGLDGLYHGEIKNGIPHGVGELRCDIVTRRGNWFNGILMDGSTQWHSGDTFVGTFYKNGNEKKGKYTFRNGVEFVGTFNDEGDFNHGRMTNLGHDRTGYYEGEFCNGKRCGAGELYLGNTLYEGNWADDKLKGEGKMITMTVGKQPNIEASGTWTDRHLTGSLRYKNGTTFHFVGEIRSFGVKTVGDGKITMRHGLMYHGEFEDNMPVGVGSIAWLGFDDKPVVSLPIFSRAFNSFCIVSPDQYTILISNGVIEPQQDPITLEDISSIMTEHLFHFRLKLDEPEPIELWHPVKLELVGREAEDAIALSHITKCPHCRLNYPDNLRTWIAAATKIQRFVRNTRTRIKKRASAATKIQRFVRSVRSRQPKKSNSRGGTKRSGTKTKRR